MCEKEDDARGRSWDRRGSATRRATTLGGKAHHLRSGVSPRSAGRPRGDGRDESRISPCRRSWRTGCRPATAHVVARVEVRAALAHDDRAGLDRRAVVDLHAEALGVRVTAVAGGPPALGLRHDGAPQSSATVAAVSSARSRRRAGGASARWPRGLGTPALPAPPGSSIAVISTVVYALAVSVAAAAACLGLVGEPDDLRSHRHADDAGGDVGRCQRVAVGHDPVAVDEELGGQS